MPSERIVVEPNTRVFVLTGAGVSAESGVPTFRGSSGLWENHPVERVASPAGFRDDPALVWRFYSQRRAQAKTVEPNAGHRALAALEQKLGDRFLLATQNVDGLHARAGSQRVVEMHGNLFRTRCSRCARPPFADDAEYTSAKLPACAECDARGEFGLLRPDIVWFGEALDEVHLARIDAFLAAEAGEAAVNGPLVFLACGTSGTVYPAAGLVRFARARGHDTWLVNREPPENAADFAHHLLGKSGEILPQLFDVRS